MGIRARLQRAQETDDAMKATALALSFKYLAAENRSEVRC